VKISGEMCVLSLICSCVVRMCVTVEHVSLFCISDSCFVYLIIYLRSFRFLLYLVTRFLCFIIRLMLV
jgi:hypothetical protein